MKDNYDFAKSYNRSILVLSLLVTVFYVLNTYIAEISSPEEKAPISKPVHIEIAKEGEPPYIVQLDDNHEVNKFVESYRLQRPPKNGDKLIITGENKIIFSRINGRKSLALGVSIGINSATFEDLKTLPGIGPKIAKRIIEYRKLNGIFKNLYELRKVHGIGEKKFKSLKQLISLD
ncbi:MAG: helix-hairpin-helix domain-containing protein [Thermodesulfobacteriota bacterium]